MSFLFRLPLRLASHLKLHMGSWMQHCTVLWHVYGAISHKYLICVILWGITDLPSELAVVAEKTRASGADIGTGRSKGCEIEL